MPRTRTLLTLVLLPFLVFLVACGDDDDDSSNAGDSQPAASDSSGGDSNSDSSSSSDSNSSDSAGSSPSIENCPEFANFASSIAGAFAGVTPGSTATDLEDSVEYFQSLADAAPDEIQADMQIIAETFGSFFTVLNDFGIDLSNPASFATLSAEQQTELQAALEGLSNPDIEQASNNVTAWFNENCS
jgi:hypothetical protein